MDRGVISKDDDDDDDDNEDEQRAVSGITALGGAFNRATSALYCISLYLLLTSRTTKEEKKAV